MSTPSTPRPHGGEPINAALVSSTPVYTNRSTCPSRPGTANAAYLASTRSAAAATICCSVAVRSRPEETASTARITASNRVSAMDEVTDAAPFPPAAAAGSAISCPFGAVGLVAHPRGLRHLPGNGTRRSPTLGDIWVEPGTESPVRLHG